MCDFAYCGFGQEPAIAMYLALSCVVLVCHQYDVCKYYFGSVSVGGVNGGLSESGICVFCKLCPACFHIVDKGSVGFAVVCKGHVGILIVANMVGKWYDDSACCELSTMYGCKVC